MTQRDRSGVGRSLLGQSLVQTPDKVGHGKKQPSFCREVSWPLRAVAILATRTRAAQAEARLRRGWGPQAETRLRRGWGEAEGRRLRWGWGKAEGRRLRRGWGPQAAAVEGAVCPERSLRPLMVLGPASQPELLISERNKSLVHCETKYSLLLTPVETELSANCRLMKCLLWTYFTPPEINIYDLGRSLILSVLVKTRSLNRDYVLVTDIEKLVLRILHSPNRQSRKILCIINYLNISE